MHWNYNWFIILSPKNIQLFNLFLYGFSKKTFIVKIKQIKNLLRIEIEFVSPEIKNNSRNIKPNLTQRCISTTHFSNLKIPNNNVNNNNKKKIFINNKIRTELRMKDFGSLRLRKKNLLNKNILIKGNWNI